MVRRDVQEHRHIGAKGRGGFQLVGGQFQHNHPVRPGIVQIAGGIADISADGDIAPGGAQAMAGQGSRCRFAVGAGDGHDPCLRRGAHGNLDLADHLDTRLGGACGGGMRLRMRVRDAGADHHRRQFGPGPILPAAQMRTGRNLAAWRGVVVMEPQARAGGRQRTCRGHAGQAETEDPDLLA